VTSVIFAAMHYLGPLGDRFTAASFVFRLLLGGVFAVLYRTRGIAVAAWTHALYDILYFALRRL
jgi:membrane protease YdiL (CAAX protease family)